MHAAINNVVFALRRNKTWSIENSYKRSNTENSSILPSEFNQIIQIIDSSPGFSLKEQDLLRNFTILKYSEPLDPLKILFPFLQIIKSGETTGLITLQAIEGIDKLLELEIINLKHENIREGTNSLVGSLTRCKFEATDSVNDELVLYSILKLLLKISKKLKSQLSDSNICEMIEVALGMYFQSRISEFLRSGALETLVELARQIFSRLKELYDHCSNDNQTHAKTYNQHSTFGYKSVVELLRVIASLLDPNNKKHIDSVHRNLGLILLSVSLETGGRELCEFITWALSKVQVKHEQFSRKKSLIDLHISSDSSQNTVSMAEASVPHHMVGLKIENDGEGSRGDSDGNGSNPEEIAKMGIMAKELIANDICKSTFQAYDLSYNSPPSWPIISLIQQSLKALGLLFTTQRIHLKYQLDWFLTWCMNTVDGGLIAWNIEDWMQPMGQESSLSNAEKVNNTHKREEIVIGEIREMILSTINLLVLEDSFLLDLYINYDGDMAMENNLFENLIRFLARNSFPDATFGGPVSTLSHQALCIDAICGFLAQISKRSESDRNFNLQDYPSPAFLLSNRERKKILIEGTTMFNENPKKGIPFLQEHGFLEKPVMASNIAEFLVENPFVDKKLLGLYLAKPDNQDILKEFVGRLGFKGKRIDEALRIMLERFRLPGESQQIERILDAFAESYYADMSKENSPIENSSVTCVLAYSIIMLHTDQHNPQRRMTFEDYSKNLRGCNEGKDFDIQFLQEIYDAIKGREILMPEEHGGHVGFSHLWKEIQAHSDAYTPLTMSHKSLNCYDGDLLLSVWKPVLASIFYVFDNTEDQIIFEKAVLGIANCATTAASYNLSDVFDYIILSLAQVAGVVLNEGHRQNDYNHGTSHSFRSADDIIAEFGRNLNQRAASVLMFAHVFKYPALLKDGWKHVMKSFVFLFENDILPDQLKVVEDLKKEKFKITIFIDKKRQITNEQGNSPRKEAGILSTLTQLLSLSSAEEENAQIEKAKNISLARDCIEKCQLEKMIALSSALDEQNIRILLKAIMYSSFKVESGNTPINEISPPKSPILNEDVYFSAASPLMLHMMTCILLENIHRYSSIGDIYLDYLNKLAELITDQIILVKCFLISVFKVTERLLQSGSETSGISQLFCILSRIDIEKYPFFIDHLLLGISLILKISITWVEESTASLGVILSILTASTMQPLASESSFEAASLLLGSKSIKKEKYGECVDLLLSYPTSAASLASQKTALGAVGESSNQMFSQVSIKALDMLFDFKNLITEWIDDSSSQKRAFFEFWLPILSGLSQQCYHPIREIRQHSFSLLEKVLLSKELTAYNEGYSDIWISCYDSVVFPLMDELTKIRGMDETASRAFALMCRLFLHISQNIINSKEFQSFWSRFLAYIKNYIVQSNQDVKEAARESLKNLLLVLSTHGIFSEKVQGEINLWSQTWQVLDPILPNFKDELFPH